MNSVNVENALVSERARIRAAIMKMYVPGMLTIKNADHPEPDAIKFNGRLYIKAVDVFKLIGFDDIEVPL